MTGPGVTGQHGPAIAGARLAATSWRGTIPAASYRAAVAGETGSYRRGGGDAAGSCIQMQSQKG